MKELKAIARKIGVKNYENLSRIRLVEEINKLEPSNELKKEKIVSKLLLKAKKRIGFKPRKGKKKNKRKRSLKLSLKAKLKKTTKNC